jgi:hypothetical protein
MSAHDTGGHRHKGRARRRCRAVILIYCAKPSKMQSIVLRKPATVAAKLACNTVIARRMATAARERPLSPHLTIYKFRVNMITSVIFRGG